MTSIHPYVQDVYQCAAEECCGVRYATLAEAEEHHRVRVTCIKFLRDLHQVDFIFCAEYPPVRGEQFLRLVPGSLA